MQTLEQAVLKGLISALSLDTSIFKSEGLSLRSGRLALLRQFHRGPIQLVIPDIVLSELRKHLRERYEKPIQSFENSINQLVRSSCISQDAADTLKNQLLGTKSADSFAEEDIGWFDSSTNLLEIPSSKFQILEELTQRYFQIQPPFEDKSDKKQEFPDAIALLTLEHWARENKTIVLVVSKDKGWKMFCEQSDNLLYSEDLESALNAINAPNTYSEKIREYIESQLEDETSYLYKSITEKIVNLIQEIEVREEFSCYLEAEPDISEVTVDELGLDVGKEALLGVSVEEITEEYVVIGIILFPKLTIHGYFNLMKWDSIDKEYMSLGSAKKKVQREISFNALITLGGNVADPQSLSVDDVELTTDSIHVDFGELEPDW